MHPRVVKFAAIAAGLALVLGTVIAAVGVLDTVRFHAAAAGHAPAAPYTFDGARIVMR